MAVDQLAPEKPRSRQVPFRVEAWRHDYPWFHRALREIGPGAQTASDNWRVRIEDELNTTLDFRVRPDGTAAVWCGMSSYDFHHEPTPKELLEGLAEAYRCELERVRGSHRTRPDTWRMSRAAPSHPGQAPEVPTPQPPVRALPAPTEDSLPRALGDLLLPRAVQLVVVFVAVTALTLVLSAVANTVH